MTDLDCSTLQPKLTISIKYFNGHDPVVSLSAGRGAKISRLKGHVFQGHTLFFIILFFNLGISASQEPDTASCPYKKLMTYNPTCPNQSKYQIMVYKNSPAKDFIRKDFGHSSSPNVSSITSGVVLAPHKHQVVDLKIVF
jgi:hypothetical protein